MLEWKSGVKIVLPRNESNYSSSVVYIHMLMLTKSFEQTS